jgi:hypothetical protein
MAQKNKKLINHREHRDKFCKKKTINPQITQIFADFIKEIYIAPLKNFLIKDSSLHSE